MQAVPGMACPSCRGELRLDGAEALACAGCTARYPIVDGIPSFVPAADPGSPSWRELSVVIPAMGQLRELDRLLPALETALRTLQIDHEVLVVDGDAVVKADGSATRHGAKFIRQELLGYGGALRAGFEHAVGEYVLTLDPYGHDPSVIGQIWPARSAAEVVIASRYIDGGQAEMPVGRRLLSWLLNRGLRRGLSLPYADLSSGYRLYRRAVLASMPLRATGFDLLQEVLIRIAAEGYRIREVPFHYRGHTPGSRRWLTRFAVSHLRTFGAMWKLRNSIASGDYDARAYDSIVPLQRYWQRRRYQLVTSMAAGADRILDVGCGSSRIVGSRPMVGLDIALAKLRYARRYGNPLVHGSIFALPFEDASFDAIICSEVIEHIPADDRVFDELERVLRPGGRLILGTPDYDRWRWRALEWLYRRLAPGGYADEHITHYSRKNLTDYLRSRGMTVEAIEYVGGSEMVFSLRTAAVPRASRAPLPSALRGAPDPAWATRTSR